MSRGPQATALLADDEALLRSRLKRQLHELWPELNVCWEAENGQQALDCISAQNPDIVFLDIRMPGTDGLQVAQQLPRFCQLVFITAYDEYAVTAFESAAVDYILKPVSRERLAQTVARLQAGLLNRQPLDLQQLLAQLTQLGRAAPQYLRWIKVARRDVVSLLAVDEIDYFQASEKYVSIYHRGEEYVISKSLKELESDLDPEVFWRIHRSSIVRLAAIDTIQHEEISGGLRLMLKGYDTPLRVSRSFAHRFRQD